MLLAEKYLVFVWNGIGGTTLAETFEKLGMAIHNSETCQTSVNIKSHQGALKAWF